MSDKKSFNFWPIVGVGVFALALLLSRQPTPSPLGGEAITSDAEYHNAELEGEKLSKDILVKAQAGTPLTPEDKKSLADAARIYDKMTTYTPTVSPLYFMSGKIHHVLGEDSIAEEKFRQCMLTFYADSGARPQFANDIRTTGAEASYQFALLAINEPNKKPALDATETAIHYIPNSAAYHVIRARVLIELRRMDEARKELHEALRIEPDSEQAKGILKFISTP